MIDVLIDEGGNMVVAHDTHSLPHLKTLKLQRSTGHLSYCGVDGEVGDIGNMLPAMVSAAEGKTTSTVVRLEGFFPGEPYECELAIC